MVVQFGMKCLGFQDLVSGDIEWEFAYLVLPVGGTRGLVVQVGMTHWSLVEKIKIDGAVGPGL